MQVLALLLIVSAHVVASDTTESKYHISADSSAGRSVAVYGSDCDDSYGGGYGGAWGGGAYGGGGGGYGGGGGGAYGGGGGGVGNYGYGGGYGGGSGGGGGDGGWFLGSYDYYDDCENTDNGATDPYGDTCDDYTMFPVWCGGYDDNDFFSMTMCCACNGGEYSYAYSPSTGGGGYGGGGYGYGGGGYGGSSYGGGGGGGYGSGYGGGGGGQYGYGGGGGGGGNQYGYGGAGGNPCGGGNQYGYGGDGPSTPTPEPTRNLEPSATPTWGTQTPTTSPLAVSVSVGLAGMTCDDYTTVEEAALITAVAASVDGIEEEHVGETECVDDGQRRRLRTSAVSVAMEIAVSATGYFDDDGEYSGADLAADISSTLSTAVSSGVLDANIATAAADAGSTVLTSVASTTIVVATKAPSAAPTPLPTEVTDAIENEDPSVGSAATGNSSDDNVLLMFVIILIALVFCACAVCVGAVVVCKMSQAKKAPSTSIPADHSMAAPVPALMLNTSAVMIHDPSDAKSMNQAKTAM